MSSSAIATAIKMMESLPEDVQDRVVEHPREYLDQKQFAIARAQFAIN